MENNNHKKRKVMLIAAFAVAVIALAGIGYATASTFMAKTVNSENTANTVFITATQSDSYTDAFTPSSTFEFNTYTDDGNNGSNGTLYTLNGGDVELGDYTGKKINSSPLTITITMTGTPTGTVSGYNISVETGTLSGAADTGYNNGNPTGWVYIMDFGGNRTNMIYSFDGGETWVDSSNQETTVRISGTSSGASTTVDLYIAAKKTFNEFDTIYEPETDDGYDGCGTASVAPAATLYDAINVTFTVTAELTTNP